MKRFAPTFGPQVKEDGSGVTFRVWAPLAHNVEVHLYLEDMDTASSPSISSIHSLSNIEGGIFSATIKEAKNGSLYKFTIDGKGPFPDPASYFQPFGVHGPSKVVDIHSFSWGDNHWIARGGIKNFALDGQDEKSVSSIYEIHIGTFTKEGTFRAAKEKLKNLKEVGFEVIEILPLADFPGRWNWGYDGVFLYAPSRAYGTPDDLRELIDHAHCLGLAVILDVVYNHLGPDGNYLSCFSPFYFTHKHTSPWGDALNIDLTPSKEVNHSHTLNVRKFLIENAMYWISVYHFDGLRLDAVHALIDESHPHFLQELASFCSIVGAPRGIFISVEDERNLKDLIVPSPEGYGLDCVWADDFHHQVRVMLTGDCEAWFKDFSGTIVDLVDTINNGWHYRGQKETSSSQLRGTDTSSISSLSKFCYCIQNHDQVGNRAKGERLNHQIGLREYKAISALLLMVPETPLIFMGQEWASSSPFQYFTDHKPDLGKLVTEGRRKEFAKFSEFSDPIKRESIPDPQAESTFLNSKLNWGETFNPENRSVLEFYKSLLSVRKSSFAMKKTQRSFCRCSGLSEESLVLVRSSGQGQLKDEETLLIIVQIKQPKNLEEGIKYQGSQILSSLIQQMSPEERKGGHLWQQINTLHLSKPKVILSSTHLHPYNAEKDRVSLNHHHDSTWSVFFNCPGAIILSF